ncbi:hypothetical protein DV736_g6231, partial [Chaetothyriales sp. CBS 134916]
MFNRSLNQRSILTILFVFSLIVFLASLRSFQLQALHQQSSQTTLPTSPPLDEFGPPGEDNCKAPSTTVDTIVIVKTGANEIYEKLPTLLLTALRDYDPANLLIFSDLGQQLGPYTIHDALDNVTHSVKSQNPEFGYYRTLQEYQENGQDASRLRESFHDAAWNLDKYKFLHMVEKTWKMRPNRKWYIFIEADTYLVQSNLRLWLARLDSSRPHYLGAPTSLNGEAFPHGGSGFILSGKALSMFADGNEGIAAEYDDAMQYEKFGDYMLMKALKAQGVKFRSSWPLLQAEKPSTLPFGPGPDTGVRHWCQPVVTMHHISPDEASQIWAFEQTVQDSSKPILMKDFYEQMIASEIRAERDDWYNLSDDLMYRARGMDGDRQKSGDDMSAIEKEAHLSFEHCRRVCEEHNRCFQFAYTDQSCGFSYSYRLGSKYEGDPSEPSFKSGWILEKIARDNGANTCSSPRWPGSTV